MYTVTHPKESRRYFWPYGPMIRARRLRTRWRWRDQPSRLQAQVSVWWSQPWRNPDHRLEGIRRSSRCPPAPLTERQRRYRDLPAAVCGGPPFVSYGEGVWQLPLTTPTAGYIPDRGGEYRGSLCGVTYHSTIIKPSGSRAYMVRWISMSWGIGLKYIIQ